MDNLTKEVTYQTISQYEIKKRLGIIDGTKKFKIEKKFHYKFWKPLKVTGGTVFFGFYIKATF